MSPPDPTAATAMLSALASVGVTRFDITHLLDATGKKRRYNEGVPGTVLRQTIPGRLTQATADECSVIIRPHKPDGIHLLQVDDICLATLAKLQPLAFLSVETSPSNYQAWLTGPDLARPIGKRLIKQLGEGDLKASGSVRIAGSINFKPKHRLTTTVVKLASATCRLTTTSELDSLGLLAEEAEHQVESSFTQRGAAAPNQARGLTMRGSWSGRRGMAGAMGRTAPTRITAGAARPWNGAATWRTWRSG